MDKKRVVSMDNNENKNVYLNEETYQKTKKKLLTLALMIFVGGLLIGGGLIVFGIIKQNSVKNSIEDSANANIRSESVVQGEIDNLNNQIKIKKDECNSIDLMGVDGVSSVMSGAADRMKCYDDLSSLGVKLQSLETELWKIQSGFNDSKINVDIGMGTIQYEACCMFGSFIIIASSMVALFVFLSAKERDILAFKAQQVMPVGKEVIGEMAPTMGKAATFMAKEAAPGIGAIVREVSSAIKDSSNDNNDSTK